jgi:hypothetical protein
VAVEKVVSVAAQSACLQDEKAAYMEAALAGFSALSLRCVIFDRR